MNCRGRAITYPIQQAIGGESAFAAFLSALHQSKSAGQARCPSCLDPMIEIKLNSGKLWIDACKSCQLTWFDHSELEELELQSYAAPIAESLEENSDNKLISLKGPKQLWKLIPGILRLPVEHTNPLVSTPWMTWSLIVSMVLIHLFFVSPYPQSFVDSWAFLPAEPWRHFGLTWITALFIHGGWIHLILNSYFLLLFGDNVEDRSSRFSYLLLFLFAGFGGTLAHSLFDPRLDIPLVGASGAISGIMLVYCLQFPKARLAKFFFVTWLSFPAWAFFAFWIIFQVLGFFDQNAGLTMVSYCAHLGGAFVGLLFWLLSRERKTFKMR